MSEIQLTEGSLVVEFGINAEGDQGYTVDWPKDISSGRIIAALEVIKARAVLDVVQQMVDEDPEDDPEPD